MVEQDWEITSNRKVKAEDEGVVKILFFNKATKGQRSLFSFISRNKIIIIPGD